MFRKNYEWIIMEVGLQITKKSYNEITQLGC